MKFCVHGNAAAFVEAKKAAAICATQMDFALQQKS
jgi:hypothetical protein